MMFQLLCKPETSLILYVTHNLKIPVYNDKKGHLPHPLSYFKLNDSVAGILAFD